MPDELKKKVSDLARATELPEDSLLMASVPDSTTESGYTSQASTIEVLGETLLGDINFETQLTTDAKTIFEAINEAATTGGGGGGSTVTMSDDSEGGVDLTVNGTMRNLAKQSDLVLYATKAYVDGLLGNISYNIPVIYASQFDTDNAFEINIRLRYSMKSTDGLLCNSSSWYGSILMQTTSGLLLALAISSNGSSADIGTIRLNFPSNNTSTIYRIVFKYNGIDAYELGLYDDEGTLITSDTITSTLKINKPGSALYIGRDLERIYDNSIFTKGTYINQGNTIVWGVK